MLSCVHLNVLHNLEPLNFQLIAADQEDNTTADMLSRVHLNVLHDPELLNLQLIAADQEDDKGLNKFWNSLFLKFLLFPLSPSNCILPAIPPPAMNALTSLINTDNVFSVPLTAYHTPAFISHR